MSVFNKIYKVYPNYLLLIILLLFFAINFDVLTDLFEKWYAFDLTGAYSHGLLVAVIVLYLVYKKTRKIRAVLIPNPSLVGFVLLIGSQSILFLAKIDGINFIQHILLITTALAIVWSVYSYRIAKQFVVPAILFSLSLPAWAGAKLILQKVAVFMTNTLLGLTGLPYYHEGPLFYFPNGIIEVAPECAGLQQLLVSLIIGLLFSTQHGLRLLDTIKILIYISIASVLINTVRIIIIMYIGYYTKMESSLITQHVLLGWVIYGVGIFLFLLFYSRVKFKPASSDFTEIQTGLNADNTKWRIISLYTGILVSVLLPSLLIFMITAKINHGINQPMEYAQTSGAWTKVSSDINSTWKPNFPDGNALVTETLENGASTIYVYINHYSKLNENIEPINMLNTPYNSKVWTPKGQQELKVSNKQGGMDNLRLVHLHNKNNQRLTVLNYFIVNGKVMSKLADAKLATLFGLLRLSYDIKVVCLAIAPMSGVDDGKTALLQFYKDLVIK